MSIRWPCLRRDEDLARAVFELLAMGGIESVTMRAVARQARMSVGTVGNHYPSKEHIWLVAAREVGALHVAEIDSRDYLSRGADALVHCLARSEPEVVELRVWHDLVSIGRASDLVGRMVAKVHRDLRNFVFGRAALSHDEPLPDGTADRLWLMLQGLRAEQAAPGTSLTCEEAAQRCRELAQLLGVPVRS